MIYVIQQSVGPIKVGVSNYTKGRLETLQTGSPFPLFLVGKFTANKNDYLVENEIHEQLKAFRMNGEWFLNSTIVCQYLIQVIEKHNGKLFIRPFDNAEEMRPVLDVCELLKRLKLLEEISDVVPMAGFEPARLKAGNFKSPVSANFTTSAIEQNKIYTLEELANDTKNNKKGLLNVTAHCIDNWVQRGVFPQEVKRRGGGLCGWYGKDIIKFINTIRS